MLIGELVCVVSSMVLLGIIGMEADVVAAAALAGGALIVETEDAVGGVLEGGAVTTGGVLEGGAVKAGVVLEDVEAVLETEDTLAGIGGDGIRDAGRLEEGDAKGTMYMPGAALPPWN